MSGATTLWSSGEDDVASSVLNIGFTFNFAGVDYTQFSVSENGMIRLGSTQVTAQYNNSNFPSGISAPAIAPFWDDFVAMYSVKYLTTGSSPNRVLVIEWDISHYSNQSSSRMHFQARLYEGSNKIEFWYGSASSPSSFSGSIGVILDTDNWLAINSSSGTASTSSSSNSQTSPSSGTLYTLEPTTTSIALTAPDGGECWLAGSSQSITWSATNITNVKIEVSSNGGSSFSTLVATTSAAPGSYTWNIPTNQTAATAYRVRISNADCALTADTSGSNLAVAAPASLTLAATPQFIWSGTNQLRTVTISQTLSGGCSPTVQLLSLTSNEADFGTSAQDSANDIQNATTGSNDTSFDLRAECADGSSGRIYTAVYKTTDGAVERYDTIRIPVVCSPGGIFIRSNSTSSVSLNAPSADPLVTTTTLSYTLPSSADVRLKVFDLSGKWQRNIDYGTKSAGVNNIVWNGKHADGSDLPDGYYICQLTALGETHVRIIRIDR